MQSTLGRDIQFIQGLPELSNDLREINPKFSNILVFDDLMCQATESPMISLLFGQGRHRNASVILLLQNMFPKGKFNTDISRNAQYMALFRSPSDRKQISIIARRMFDQHSSRFMTAYAKETEKPYGYILVDNPPDTSNDKQVLSDIFRSCHCYPTLTSKPSKSSDEPPTVTGQEQPGAFKPTVQAKSATLKVKQPVKVTAGTSNVKQPVKVTSVKVKPTVKAKPAKVKPTVKVNRQFKQPAMQTVKRAVKPRRDTEKARKRKADPVMESVTWEPFELRKKIKL